MERARRLSSELRYEEAVVEYQRYLGVPGRPSSERARALFELGFLHQVLRDPVSAEARGLEALAAEPTFTLPKEAPARQQQFLADLRQKYESRPRLELHTPLDAALPEVVRVRTHDPSRRIAEVWLWQADGPEGPFRGRPMKCEGELCEGRLQSAQGATSFTAWYFVDAKDAEGVSLARAASPEAPQRISVLAREPWYQSPWVWGSAGALLVGAAAVFYLASAPPR